MKDKANIAENRKVTVGDVKNSIRKWILKLLLSIIVLTLFIPVSGQNPKYIFNHLGLENGLSNLNISSFAKDELGFIWIGTEDGLNRFDGTNLKVFKTVPGDSGNSISNNNILALFAHEHYLFVGTMGSGIDRYNLITDKFEHFYYAGKEGKKQPTNISVFYRLNSGNILVGSESGLFEFNNKTNELKPYLTEILDNISDVDILSIWEEENGRIWLGTDNDVFSVSPDKKTITHHSEILDVEDGNHWVQHILQGPDKNFYVYKQRHLLILDQNFGKILKKKEFENYIPNVKFDFLGRLWIVSDGLILYHNDEFVKIQNDPLDPNSLSDNIGKTIFIDNDGTIWYGSWNTGVSYFNPSHQRHRINNLIYRGDNYGLPNNPVDFIFEDSEQKLWIGTNWGGITIYDPVSEQLKFISSDPKSSPRISVNLNYAAFQQNNKIWIGTFRKGLDCYNIKTKQISNYPIQIVQGQMPKINKIATDSLSPNNLLICTEVGLFEFNTETGESFYYDREKFNLPYQEFTDLCYIDKSTAVIVVYKVGLFLFEKSKKSFTPFLQEQISSSLINTVFYDTGNDLLLIGSQHGMYVYDNATKKIFHFNISDGLANENVVSIVKEKRGFFWLSTLNGLSLIQLTRQINGNIAISQIKNFYKSDGLVGNQFRARTSLINSKGEILLGSNSGLCIFNPEIFSFATESPKVFISDLKISNQAVKVNPENSKAVLEKNIFYTNYIELTHKQNSISFEFAALDFFLNNNAEYRYKLEGFDNDWIKTQNGTAVYTNLNPGHYVFYVDLNNMLTPHLIGGTKIEIYIKPPFYLTTYFQFGAVTFLLIVFFSFYFLRLRNYKLRQIQLENTVSQRTSELKSTNEILLEKNIEIKNMAKKVHEADEMKLRFFANVHHEFRTSLSLIIGPVEQILKYNITDTKFAADVKIIASSSKRLLGLVNEILEYRKIDAGKLKLSLVKSDIINFLQEIVSLFNVKAEEQKINFVFRSSIEKAEIYFDSKKFENIIFNLLSNAFKFTQSGGEIIVEVKQIDASLAVKKQPRSQQVKINPAVIHHHQNKYIEIAIIDNGIGFQDEKQIQLIWERFYRMPSKNLVTNTGSGIGLAITKELTQIHQGLILAESNKTGGATFRVWFPAQEDWFVRVEDVQVETGIRPATTRLVDIDENEVLSEKAWKQKSIKPNNSLPTVLVVEDNVEIHHFLNNHLTNYNLKFVISGKEGIEMAKKIVPDLIVCDIMLPDFHGYHVVKELKQHIATSHIPVIMLTALVSEDNVIKALNIGADDYVTKPFTIDRLKARINNLLHLREKLREIYSLKTDIKPEEISANPVDQKFYKKLIEIINENVENYNFSVVNLAESMNMSRIQLYRKVNSITNNGPADMIRKIRMQYSKELLKNSGLSVSEIAIKVGYSESSSFIRAFIQEYEISPLNFSKKYNSSSDSEK
jgi:signal transduction histidine kinase/DNA-binding response OmpR family regulator/ligand-binding sensor domain-containing protein